MDKKQKNSRCNNLAPGWKSRNLKQFEKKIANCKRFPGTRTCSTVLSRDKTGYSSNEKLIVVSTDKELSENYLEDWKKAKNVPISRRDWPDSISILILYLDLEGYLILKKDQSRLDIPDIDSLFGDDPDCRALSDYFEADESGELPKRKIKRMNLLRFIELLVRIYHQIK